MMLPLAGHADTKKPGAVFKDCETCPEMVVIPAGSFKMGGKGGSNEKPVHEVKIGYSFAVGKYEVTQAEWEAVMGKRTQAVSRVPIGQWRRFPGRMQSHL